MLREYTVLLDPPTFAPPAAQQAPAVTAPRRSAPADSGRIERQQPAAPPPSRHRAAAHARQPQPQPSARVDDTPYETGSGRDYLVQRGDTLWGIANRMRPDGRLTMNQTMVAIYEANPEAFGGNINLLRAGAALRVPSADEIFRISRGNAFGEVQRQNEAWGSGTVAPAAETRPSLTLVPPDEEPEGVVYDDEVATAEPLTREQEIENRISQLESADVPDQPSLIEIRDNELATLRQELANIRGEVYEPLVEAADDPFVDEALPDDVLDQETVVDEAIAVPDDLEADSAVADEATTTPEVDTSTTVVQTTSSDDAGIVERILGFLSGTWAAIIGALVVIGGLLFWFMRRGDGDSDGDGIAPWEPLDSDELPAETFTATETLKAPTPDEAILVVEQDSAIRPHDDTTEIEAVELVQDGAGDGAFGSLEDTFSSDTALNLDQSDPLAEADFHMAYGLYDQAADLVHGALEADPTNLGLMSKLCEIYFVWGNRDAFVDAASNLKSAVGDGDNAEWDKIVIMGQQIAGDHALFAGAAVAGATQAVDLSFEEAGGDAGALDMDFGGGSDTMTSDAIDLGSDDGLDFPFGDDDEFEIESTLETPGLVPGGGTAKTVAMPAQEYDMEAATIDEKVDLRFDDDTDGTSELPSIDATIEQAIEDIGQDSEATAEINLDDLDLDIGGIAETELAALDDLDSSFIGETLSDDELADAGSITGKNPRVDPTSTGVHESLGLDDLLDDDETGEMRLAADETGRNPMLDAADDAMAETEVSIDSKLLDATGVTQVLSDDLAVDTLAGADAQITDDAATLLASLDDDDDAGTKALPADVFAATSVDETGELPAVPGSTDVDLDLDDLTAALKNTEIGDTLTQAPDDETVEQPMPMASDSTAEIATMSLGPEDVGDDLHEARTMTEVGTKLDLARAYVDMGDPAGARSILEEVLEEGDEGQRQQAKQLIDTLPG